MTQPQFGEFAEHGPNDVCFRHSDRPSFTLCQRCGRTICPDCQHQESVGMLCPVCVSELQPSRAERGFRAGRAQVRKATDSSTPVVTYAILATCAVVWIAQMLVPTVTDALWYAPLYSLPDHFEPWRQLTSMFTHSTSSVFHILFNMYALWLFGRNLELMLGRGLYATLYVLAGLGGAVAVQLWGYTSFGALNVATVGASGAIFGILAATLVVYRKLRVNVTSLAVLLGINFAIGFLPGTHISWQAHLGGMIVGALVMLIIVNNLGERKRGVRAVELLLVLSVLVALALSYFVISPLRWLVG